MCCTYSSICWSNTKRFLSILVVFGECFCFEKFQKIQKYFNFAFWRLTREFQGPSHEVTQKCLRLSGKWDFQLWKTFRKFFKNFGFLTFWWLIFATPSRMEVQVARLLRGVHDSLASGSPSHKKNLEKIFKILIKGFWRLSYESCEPRKTLVLHK